MRKNMVEGVARGLWVGHLEVCRRGVVRRTPGTVSPGYVNHVLAKATPDEVVAGTERWSEWCQDTREAERLARFRSSAGITAPDRIVAGDRLFVGGWPAEVLSTDEVSRTVCVRIFDTGEEGAPF